MRCVYAFGNFLFVFEYSLVADYSSSSKFVRIAQKLGIPEPPKRPTMGYIRFQQENLASLKQSTKSQQELVSLAAAKWRHLSAEEKEKYNKQFNAEMVRCFTILILLCIFI